MSLCAFFVYTMSQVQICACTRICIWRMYIIELLSEMEYKVYKLSRSETAQFKQRGKCAMLAWQHLTTVHHLAVKRDGI